MQTQTLNLLLVEDNLGDANLLRVALRKADDTSFTLSHAEDLESAIELLQSTCFDVVLLDLSLPDSMGLETLERVQSQTPHTPILVLTGNSDNSLGVKALQAGAEDYLVKGSIDGWMLTKAMRFSIERHRILTQLKEYDRQKSEFLATASHELRTPLTIIREFVSLVHDEVVGPILPEQATCLSDALRNCDRLTGLLNDLLDMSKLKSTNIDMRRRKVEPSTLLTNCFHDFEEKCRAKNIALHLEAPEVLPTVLCDPDRISQALVNLLGNACKFTPEGGTIVIKAEERQPWVKVAIKDTGKGISEQDQEVIFEAFTQVDRQDGPGAKGTGLGLAITKRIVELHGGILSVESKIGEGSTFTFTLPVYESRLGLIASLEDMYLGIRSDKTVSLVLLRVGRKSYEQEDLTEPLLEEAYSLSERALRPGDKCMLLESENLIAFVLDSDEAGSFAALRRLVSTVPEISRSHATFEAVVSEASPAGPVAGWAEMLQGNFVRLE